MVEHRIVPGILFRAHKLWGLLSEHIAKQAAAAGEVELIETQEEACVRL